MGKGAEKYGDWNWTHIGEPKRYVAAALRHLMQAQISENDEETGLPHLAHAAASCLIALELSKESK